MRHDTGRGHSAVGRATKILAVVALTSAIVSALGACGRNATSAPPPPEAKPVADQSLASVHADAPGIAWFNGDEREGI